MLPASRIRLMASLICETSPGVRAFSSALAIGGSDVCMNKRCMTCWLHEGAESELLFQIVFFRALSINVY